MCVSERLCVRESVRESVIESVCNENKEKEIEIVGMRARSEKWKSDFQCNSCFQTWDRNKNDVSPF